MLGVFEVINKQVGEFTADDEAALSRIGRRTPPLRWKTRRIGNDCLLRIEQMVDQAAEHVRLIGNSPAIDALRSTVRRVADTDLAVLVLGENGTGKEVVSQLIHYLSPAAIGRLSP